MPYHRRCHNTPPAHPPLTSTRAATTAHSPVGAVDGVSRPVWRARSLHAGRLPAHLRLVPTSADLRAPAPTQRSTCLLPLLSASALEAVTASASAAVTAAAASGRSVQKARGWKQFEPTSVSSSHCLCLCVASLSHYLAASFSHGAVFCYRRRTGVRHCEEVAHHRAQHLQMAQAVVRFRARQAAQAGSQPLNVAVCQRDFGQRACAQPDSTHQLFHTSIATGILN